MVNGL